MAKYLDENGLSRFWTKIKDFLTGNYQSKLISGTNIKTVNNQSLLGSGNIAASGGGDSFVYEAPASVYIEVEGSSSIITIEFTHSPNPCEKITLYYSYAVSGGSRNHEMIQIDFMNGTIKCSQPMYSYSLEGYGIGYIDSYGNYITYSVNRTYNDLQFAKVTYTLYNSDLIDTWVQEL